MMEWWSIDLKRIHYSVTPTLHHSNDLLFPRRRHSGMARLAGEKGAIRSLGNARHLLPKLMQKLGLKERLRETEVIDVWSSIVGEFIATHSAPVASRDGIL
jgi:predicted nucleic acid-binding Zn ribbon protein